MKEMSNFARILIPLLCKLVTGVDTLSNNMSNLEHTLPVLTLIQDLLQIMETLDIDHEFENNILHRSVEHFNEFYCRMCDYLMKDDEGEGQSHMNIYENPLRIAAYKQISMILVEIQVYYNEQYLSYMPKWLDKVFDVATKMTDKEDKAVLLTSVQILQNILEVCEEEGDETHGTIKKLQQFIISQDSGGDDASKLISTLWNLMDEQGDNFLVVQQLKRLDQYTPQLFSEVVIGQLKSEDKETKYNGLRNFSIFWRLTAHDTSYRPFLTMKERQSLKEGQESTELDDIFDGLRKREVAESAVESDRGDEARSQLAIHIMLDILEDEDPSMRMTCRSWL